MTEMDELIGLLIVFTILGLLPAAIAKTRGQDFFVWWVYGAFLFPIALLHAFFVRPGSTAVDRFVKGARAPSAAEKDQALKARMDAWHTERDRARPRRHRNPPRDL